MKKSAPLTTLSLLIVLLSACRQETPVQHFGHFLSAPCMIVNQQEDNNREGTYLVASQVDPLSLTLTLNLPAGFSPGDGNDQWVIGWGNQAPLLDAGVENLRTIKSIDLPARQVTVGELLKGQGLPAEGQRVVLWNTTPSGFRRWQDAPLIDPSLWQGIHSRYVHFGPIAFDSLMGKWVMLFNEVNKEGHHDIYAALSDNLVDWLPASQGLPVLSSADFTWTNTATGATHPQALFVSDAIRHQGRWHLYFYGYDTLGRRAIGLATSSSTIMGPYEMMPEPVLHSGPEGSWNETASFYPRVVAYKDHFLMFFNGRNHQGVEQVGLARSPDLVHWQTDPASPVLARHSGWRSKSGVSEPAHVMVRQDSVFLMVAGAKEFQKRTWHHRLIPRPRMYMDKSGNVDTAQLGVFLSVDGGTTFVAHPGNPVFVNDFSHPYENKHLGANFRYIPTDSLEYIFYQAKSDAFGPAYNVMLRVRDRGTGQ